MPIIHRNFKSVDPNVYDAESMNYYVYEALIYQFMFERRTTPWEKDLWNYDELQAFTIKLEEVDRLYYIYYRSDVDGKEFKMVARVDHKGQSLYIEMNASCDFTGFDCEGQGCIFISSEANLFMKLIMTSDLEVERISQSLEEDGIKMETLDQFDRYSHLGRRHVSMLMYLCHQTIYDHRDTLEKHIVSLPKYFQNNVREFNRTQDAILSYDNM